MYIAIWETASRQRCPASRVRRCVRLVASLLLALTALAGARLSPPDRALEATRLHGSIRTASAVQRRQIARRLGEIRDMRSYGYLSLLAKDRDSQTRNLALQSLTHYLEGGQPSAAQVLADIGPTALPVLLPLLDSPRPQLVLGAVSAMSNMRDPRARQALLRVMRMPANDQMEAARCKAAESLAIDPPAESGPDFLKWLQSSDKRESFIALRAFGKLRYAPAVPFLLTLDSSANPYVIDALGRQRAPEVFDFAVARLSSPTSSEWVKSSSISALRLLGDRRAIPYLKQYGTPNRSREAALALVEMGDESGWPVLLDTSEESPSLAFADLPEPERTAAFLEKTIASKAQHWQEALILLAQAPAPLRNGALRRLAANPDPEIAKWCGRALASETEIPEPDPKAPDRRRVMTEVLRRMETELDGSPALTHRAWKPLILHFQSEMRPDMNLKDLDLTNLESESDDNFRAGAWVLEGSPKTIFVSMAYADLSTLDPKAGSLERGPRAQLLLWSDHGHIRCEDVTQIFYGKWAGQMTPRSPRTNNRPTSARYGDDILFTGWDYADSATSGQFQITYAWYLRWNRTKWSLAQLWQKGGHLWTWTLLRPGRGLAMHVQGDPYYIGDKVGMPMEFDYGYTLSGGRLLGATPPPETRPEVLVYFLIDWVRTNNWRKAEPHFESRKLFDAMRASKPVHRWLAWRRTLKLKGDEALMTFDDTRPDPTGFRVGFNRRGKQWIASSFADLHP